MGIKYTHTNLIVKDRQGLIDFYQTVFECVPVYPERDLSGEWLDKATGLEAASIKGIHLRLPGYGSDGPTLEVFAYADIPEHPSVKPNTPGFSHIAFAVEDVKAIADQVFSQGGSAVGELTVRDIEGVGRLTFQYVTDPEGNIIEIQAWGKSEHDEL